MITWNEIIEAETKTIPANINEKNVTCKKKIILLAFSLTTPVLLIAVSIYCCLTKCKKKQKKLLPFYIANGKLINDKLKNEL